MSTARANVAVGLRAALRVRSEQIRPQGPPGEVAPSRFDDFQDLAARRTRDIPQLREFVFVPARSTLRAIGREKLPTLIVVDLPDIGLTPARWT